MRNLCHQRQQIHRCRNLQLSHRNRLSKMILASSPSCRYTGTKLGGWKYELHMSSFTTTRLNLLFTEAEQQGKTRNFRMFIGPGSDGSSADKLSLDLKFNPSDTVITFRPEWRSMSKTLFTQYDPFEPWYTEQSNMSLDDVKKFYPRPMRCVIVVHPFPLAQEDTT